jgi:hypothetical protein
MQRKTILLFVCLLLFASILLLVFLQANLTIDDKSIQISHTFAPTESLIAYQPITLTPVPTDPNWETTVSFEHTALAQYTANPQFAISSTPYFAQIIYNDLIRNLTEIPYPVRGYWYDPAWLTATLDPNILVPCTQVLETRELHETSDVLLNAINSQLVIPVLMTAQSTGLSMCSPQNDFFPVYSSMSILIESSEAPLLNPERVKEVLRLLVDNRDKMTYVALNPRIVIWVTSDLDDTNFSCCTVVFDTDLDAVIAALDASYEGDAFIAALGGYSPEANHATPLPTN